MSEHDPTEVKGLWFVSTRAYLLDAGGEGLVQRIGATMGGDAPALLEPMSGSWYPEATLHAMLEGLWSVVEHDRALFVEHMTGATRQGVGTFFRLLMSLGSAGFVLRKVPVMWGRLRRNDRARIDVESEDGATVLHYRDFPWFRHDVYVMMTEGSLRALVETATGRTPELALLDRGDDYVRVRVKHPGAG